MRKLEHTPLMQSDTRIDLIPRLWFEYVEPRIARGRDPYPSCWLYLTKANEAPDHGEPRVYVGRKPILIKHMVAEMFWPGIQCRGQNARHFVYHECGVINCMNPNHFLVCKEHPQWFNLQSFVVKKQNSLRRWKKELEKKNVRD